MTLNSHEQKCLENATSFTAVRGMGAKRTRKDFSTFEDAVEYGNQYGDRRTMIYAITKMGSSAHICNI